MIKWVITQIESVQASGMVFIVHWLAYIIDDEEPAKFGAPYYGSLELSLGTGEFIPYENLTEEIVLGWVWSSIDKTTIENKLKSILDDKISGTSVSGLPWKNVIPDTTGE